MYVVVQASHVLVALALVGCLKSVWSADIQGIAPGIVLPDSVGAESDETVSCFAAIYPYSTWQPAINSSSRQPTSSPVPPYVEGSIDFSVFNYGSSDIPAPWTLGIYNPYYTQVLQVMQTTQQASHH